MIACQSKLGSYYALNPTLCMDEYPVFPRWCSSYSPRAMFIFHSSLCYFAQLWIFLWLPYIETIIQIESLPCKLPSVNRAPYPAGLLISDPVAIKPCLAEILTLTQRMRGRGFTHICVWCVLLSSLWEKGEQFLSWRENVDTPSPDPRVIFE